MIIVVIGLMWTISCREKLGWLMIEVGLMSEESLSVQTFGSEVSETKNYTKRKIKIRGMFPGAKVVQIRAL